MENKVLIYLESLDFISDYEKKLIEGFMPLEKFLTIFKNSKFINLEIGIGDYGNYLHISTKGFYLKDFPVLKNAAGEKHTVEIRHNHKCIEVIWIQY